MAVEQLPNDDVLSVAKLVAALDYIATNCGDVEEAHQWADRLLLEHINDPDVTKAFHAIRKWYS